MMGIPAPKIGRALMAFVDLILMRDQETAYNEGSLAASVGFNKNPYPPRTKLHRAWRDGYFSVKYHDERNW